MIISSDFHLLRTDRHTRVTAGPGAGKTFWLANHIRNVIGRSKRLHPNAKVAVISYTNVAADQLKEQLGAYALRTDTSTIHSFLYRHIVRPYAHLIYDGDGKSLVATASLDGHREHHVNQQHLRAWLSIIKLQITTAKFKKVFDNLTQCIKTIHWHQADTKADWYLQLGQCYGLGEKTKAKITRQALLLYKHQYWREGKIDHDDVLYLAFCILTQHQIVRECLSAQFPYVFVDEFQDTVPAQTQIVRWLAEAGSTVTIIGDPEQAIFKFAGAEPEHFRAFTLPDIDEYKIAWNRRSTHTIVALLNHMRTDGIKQECHSATEAIPVQLLVGPVVAAANHVRTSNDGAPTLILSRNQSIVDELLAGKAIPEDNPWKELEVVDPYRSRLLKFVSMALVLAGVGRFELSIDTLLRGIRPQNGVLKDPFRAKGTEVYTTLDRQAIAVTILETLLGKGAILWSGTVRQIYTEISEALGKNFTGLSLSAIKGGKFATLADQLTMKEITDRVLDSDTDEVRNIRTIHKAKGKEEDCVLVCLHHTKGEERLRHVTNPKSPSDEEQRLTYVAVSRARRLLYLAVPELNPEDEHLVQDLGIDVLRLP